jgi:hypothetical protein
MKHLRLDLSLKLFFQYLLLPAAFTKKKKKKKIDTDKVNWSVKVRSKIKQKLGL